MIALKAVVLLGTTIMSMIGLARALTLFYTMGMGW
jgi:hypothetical protein